MEQYLVKKVEKPIDWCVTVPGSKSMTNRALLMAALSSETVTLEGVLFSDDWLLYDQCIGADEKKTDEGSFCIVRKGWCNNHLSGKGRFPSC